MAYALRYNCGYDVWLWLLYKARVGVNWCDRTGATVIHKFLFHNELKGEAGLFVKAVLRAGFDTELLEQIELSVI